MRTDTEEAHKDDADWLPSSCMAVSAASGKGFDCGQAAFSRTARRKDSKWAHSSSDASRRAFNFRSISSADKPAFVQRDWA